MNTLHCLLLALLMCGLSFAQEPTAVPSNPTTQSSIQSQDPGQSLADMARKLRKDHSEETKMTPEDAKKLFTAVDRISAFASEDSGFPLRTTIKRRVVSPEEVEKASRAKMAREDYSERFSASELSMKKFGLLPRDFNLREFLVKVNRKEIAGYYDDETKVISMVNTIPLEQQEAVLAHELTHALQDQNYDLHTWAQLGNSKNDRAVVADGSDEIRAARRAVVEGQASVVFVDYLLARAGRSLQNTPGLIYRMEDPIVKAPADSQMLHDAPMILRAEGTFPYREGLIFEGELLQAGGKQMAFAGAFANPPRNTHEILHPKAYLEHEKVSPVVLPDVRILLAGKYEVFDSGSIGELDVKALLWQFGTRTFADDLSKSWQGGSYVTLKHEGATPSSTADLAFLYVSRWSSSQAAQRFVKFYASSLAKRYQSPTPGQADSCTGNECAASSIQVLTEEGEVTIRQWPDNTVVVSEGFDKDTAAKLNNAAHAAGQKGSRAWATPESELGMRFYDLPAFRKLQQSLGEELFDLLGARLATR
jgi:phosphopantetheinyl transferase (holo-ACP synthase)